MKNSRLWLIPLCFFILCCGLNLTGCFISPVLKATVKPGILTLLCVTTLAWLMPRLDFSKKQPGVALLITAQLMGCVGDTLLIGDGFLFFASGIGAFLIGHIFYILLFGGWSFKGLKPWQWIAGIACGIAVTCVMVICVGVNGAMLVPMGVYAMALAMLIFSTLAGALRFGGCTWWILVCGAVLFTFSDLLIAINTFIGVSDFVKGFGVMSTYMLAQGLLAIGACRLLASQSPRQE